MMYVSGRCMKLFTVASILFVGNAMNEDVAAMDEAKYLRAYVGLTMKAEKAAEGNYWGTRAKNILLMNKNVIDVYEEVGSASMAMFTKLDNAAEKVVSSLLAAKVVQTPAQIGGLVEHHSGSTDANPDLSKLIMWRPFDYKISTTGAATHTEVHARDAEDAVAQDGGVENQEFVEAITCAFNTKDKDNTCRFGKHFDVSLKFEYVTGQSDMSTGDANRKDTSGMSNQEVLANLGCKTHFAHEGLGPSVQGVKAFDPPAVPLGKRFK